MDWDMELFGKGEGVDKQILKPMRGFSKAVMVTCGRLLFISGEGPLDEDGNIVGKDDIEAQTRRTFQNLQNTLAEAGATLGNVVKMTYFLTDANDTAGFRKARAEFLKDECPAASLVIVGLGIPDMKLEIEAVAALD